MENPSFFVKKVFDYMNKKTNVPVYLFINLKIKCYNIFKDGVWCA